MGPQATRYGQGMKKPRGRSVGGLIASTHSACRDVCLSVSIHGGPPEMLFHEGQSMTDSWVASKPGSADPLEDLGVDQVQYKQMIWGACYLGLAAPIRLP